MAATITFSEIKLDSIQADGRRSIIERHVDSLGAEYQFIWLAPANADANVVLAARAISLLADRATGEIATNIAAVSTIGSIASPTLFYSTTAANLAALRAIFPQSTQTQAIMIGDFLSSLTSAQLQTIFAMTAGQVTTLRANRLTPAASAAVTIRAAVGQ